MRIRLFGCGKFSWLLSEAQDRPLRQREARFMERHRAVCRECKHEESHGAFALNMLRMSAIEHAASSAFDERVLRMYHVHKVKASLTYWSPAVIGAAVALVAVLAGVQMITRSSELPVFSKPNVETMRVPAGGTRFPSLEGISLERVFAP